MDINIWWLGSPPTIKTKPHQCLTCDKIFQTLPLPLFSTHKMNTKEGERTIQDYEVTSSQHCHLLALGRLQATFLTSGTSNTRMLNRDNHSTSGGVLQHLNVVS